ncbi:FbpB family small basic protein [Cerasibacillus terrae]|uniref:FbpB family small basic protein n=1 Tax=Cerasibacillus terrae TaxID=2498845 RepID=A0A5C8P2D6_9BACI|nr:FbpB family small basic protein [Cerasibacillus terrae]TXL67532.1 FbpB family small basic protein [Cerasibacillus terrae]
MRTNKLTYEQLVEQFKQELMADEEQVAQIELRMEERLASHLDKQKQA